MGLRLRILLPIITLVVLLLSVSGYFSYSNAYKSLGETLRMGLEREAEAFERASTAYMRSAVLDITRTAQSREVGDFLQGYMGEYDKEILGEYMTKLIQTYPAQEAITLVNTKGRVRTLVS